MIICTIATIIMFFVICAFIYPKVYLVFTMNKGQFIRKIEKTYGQKIEIVQDNSSRKGNGTMILRTKKEPKVEFHAAKNVYDTYKLDLEESVLIYYAERTNEPIFQGLRIEKQQENFHDYPEMDFIKCNAYIEIEVEEQIEEAVTQLWKIQKFMEKKIKQFKVPIYLKLGEYQTWINYQPMSSLEETISREKNNYERYLQSNAKTNTITSN